MMKNAFSNLQKVGKSLMLPVSVLPVAGILLGVGAANFSWLPEIVSHLMEQAGGSVFGQMLCCSRWVLPSALPITTVYPVCQPSLATAS